VNAFRTSTAGKRIYDKPLHRFHTVYSESFRCGIILWNPERFWGPLTSTWCRGQRMSGAIPPLPQYAVLAWCSVKVQGQLYLFTFIFSVQNDMKQGDTLSWLICNFALQCAVKNVQEVAKFKYLGTRVTNHYYIHEEVKMSLKSGNAC